jgi:hypothetical protein
MSLISAFVDAFRKAAGKRKPDVDMKTYGPMGSTTQEGGKGFDPLRPAPAPDHGAHAIDGGDLSVASSDPEEGGEATRS